MRSPAALGWTAVTVVLVLFLTLGQLVQLTDLGFGLWYTEIFVILGTSWVLTRASGRDPLRYVRLDRPAPGPMAFGFLLGVVNYFAVVIPIQFVATSLAPQSMQRDESQIFKHGGSLEIALVITAVGLAAPFCEETLFRGLFQQGLVRSALRPITGVLIAAAVFSGFHFDVVGFAARFELGILFGLLMLRYDSLWPGMMAHAANNLVPTALYFASAGAATANQEPTAQAVLTVGGLGLGALALLFAAARFLPPFAPRNHEPAPPPEALRRPGQLLQSLLPWALGAAAALILILVVKSPGWVHLTR